MNVSAVSRSRHPCSTEIRRRWPTAIDLFSGIGGLTLGLRQARFRVVAALEISALAVGSYGLNFPRIPVLRRDIRQVLPEDLLRRARVPRGDLDLLAGCPPCQGFSILRTRNKAFAVEDDRNDLVAHFLRLVRGVLPRLVLMENVPGLVGDSRFDELIAGLRASGYSVDWKVLDVANFGVPQRRRRLVLAGSRVDHPELTEGRMDSPTVRSAIGHMPKPGSSGDSLHDHGEFRSPRVRALIESVPIDGGSRSALGPDNQLTCHQRCNGFSDVYGRMRWDGPAPTITSGCVNPSKGRFLHPVEPRAITLREALMLQGFPAGHRLSMERGKYAAAELIGNAIPPAFVRAQAKALRPLVQLVPRALA